MTVHERFEQRIGTPTKAGCWPWLGAKNAAGYGHFNMHARRMQATHASLLLYRGITVAPGQMVCHHCDTPSCVNPDHLFVGSQRDNMEDAVAKGRVTPPPRPPHNNAPAAILTAEQASAARRLRRAGANRQELADRFGVSLKAMSKLLSGATWRNLDEAPVRERLYVRSHGKITAEIVRVVRRRYAAGESQSALAREYGVASPTIHAIVRRKSWRHITEEP